MLGLAGAFVLMVPTYMIVSTSASAVAANPTGAGQAPLTAAQAKALSNNVTKNVIVVLKNQVGDLPDSRRAAPERGAAVAGLQAPVLGELTRTRAQNVKSLELVNAITARVSPGEARRLASNPAVAEVVPDEPIPLVGSVPSLDASGSGLTPLPGACSAGSTVQLDPQAVELSMPLARAERERRRRRSVTRVRASRSRTSPMG